MKFATHILAFNQDKWILKNIDSVGEWVDKIYVSYSKYPWSYNPKARDNYVNKFDLEILKKSKYYKKIEIIKGIWETDEDQRNVCLDKSKKDGFDFLFIIDADEFYTKKDMNNLIEYITNNPNHDVYTCDWISFWKNFDYVIQNSDGNIIVGQPEICINLKKNINFYRCRSPEKKFKRHYISNILCYHASFILSNNECLSKINTWGHSHQFNTEKWFKEKWLNWSENTENLHPVSPSVWKRAIKFKGNLPEVL